ncbi:MAG: TetR/AcrR family transcriptional regulator [Actinomycetota bacterium]
MSSPATVTRSRGRPIDRTKDATMLAVTIDILRDLGYERLTVAEVARRSHASKATIYRRWPTKAALVIAAFDAATHTGNHVPQTGNLRDDLLALVTVMAKNVDRLGSAVHAIIGEMSHNPEFAAAFRDGYLRKRLALAEEVFAAAAARGETRPDVDLTLIGQIIPAMALFNVSMMGEHLTPATIRYLVEKVVLPAVLPAETQPTR